MSTNVQNTLNQIINQTNLARYENGRKNVGTGEIDKIGFLNLLMAQLQNQNPLNPMDNAEFVSQNAQFAQLDQLTELNQSFKQSGQISDAANWVGRNVEYYLPGESGTFTGTVDSVSISSEGLSLELNGQSVPISPEQVVRISS